MPRIYVTPQAITYLDPRSPSGIECAFVNNLSMVRTRRYGNIVAAEDSEVSNGGPRETYTFVLGTYNGGRRLPVSKETDSVETSLIPPEQQRDVSRILRRRGWRQPIKYLK